jgi:mRNA interferase HigB
LREFWEQHPDAETPLRAWHRLVLKADWQTLSEVHRGISNADAVHAKSGVLTVFNIGGNKYQVDCAYEI